MRGSCESLWSKARSGICLGCGSPPFFRLTSGGPPRNSNRTWFGPLLVFPAASFGQPRTMLWPWHSGHSCTYLLHSAWVHMVLVIAGGAGPGAANLTSEALARLGSAGPSEHSGLCGGCLWGGSRLSVGSCCSLVWFLGELLPVGLLSFSCQLCRPLLMLCVPECVKFRMVAVVVGWLFGH